jgi:hypothetical protein
VGERSYGKGSMQKVEKVRSMPSVTLIETIARFYLPSGRTNQIEGVLPDIEAYATPNPTEDDKFALREEELFPNALPAVGAPWVQPRPKVINTIKQCLANRFVPAERYAKHLDDAIAPDYQLMVGEDVLRCAIAAKVAGASH